MANIKSIGGNPIVLGLDGLSDEVTHGYNPALSVGRADALTGADGTAQWAQRESTGSGAATVRSVQGAAVSWNQLIKLVNQPSPAFGVTITTNPATGLVSYSGTTTQGGGRNSYIATNIPWVAGHKYLFYDTINYSSDNTVGWVLSDTTSTSFVIGITGGTIYTAGSDHICWIGKNFASSGEVYDCSGYVSLYDLTQMFGSGNEPTTVAEFERMYPEAYYPYSAPTLKPVQIAGIRSTTAQGGELDSVEWTAQTLRAAGNVRDELTSDELVTRVGAVDLGTLTWTKNVAGTRWESSSLVGIIAVPATQATMPNIATEKYTPVTSGSSLDNNHNGITVLGDGRLFAYADADTPSPTGLMFYELATPTTQTISPALPMSYKVEQGGSESIIVPDGEVSAAPVLTVAEGESAGELVMDALACIAAPDGPVATANHAINTYLTMQGKLYKVTSAIAVGETITPNTNVSETTVMAELIARTA